MWLNMYSFIHGVQQRRTVPFHLFSEATQFYSAHLAKTRFFAYAVNMYIENLLEDFRHFEYLVKAQRFIPSI
jgi:hypothetical protein